MTGVIHRFLADDHARLDTLLDLAMARPDEPAAYDQLRAGLLRHIAMEEKILFADARARRSGRPLPIVKRLHADHAALASLLIPSPTLVLLHTVRAVLDDHNPLEEGEHGLYETCEQLAGEHAPVLLARMQAIPPVRMSAHIDDTRIHEHIERMLAARLED